MKIETKFNVGDIVYVCKKNTTKDLETCKICDGKGAITVKGESFCCPKCHGNKFTSTKRIIKFIPEKRNIRKVIVCASENNGNIQIYTRYGATAHGNRNRMVADYENIMFATREEAEYRCKELNGEIIKTPPAMLIKDFADKIKVSPAKIIQWLFLRGKIVKNYYSEIWFDDMKEFADQYGLICEKEAEE